MLSNKKSGATNAFMILAIFIGLVLIIAAIYMMVIEKGNVVDPYADVEEKIEPVSTKVDSVPIPTGFYYVGGTKVSGVVISDNVEDKEKGDNHETAKNLVGNQYVWIPVNDFEKFERKISNQFTQSANGTVSSIIGTDSLENGINLWEVTVEENTSQQTGVKSKIVTKAKTNETLEEAKAIYESIKKYGGFYIARYEAGLVSPRVITQDVSTNTRYYAALKANDIMFKAGTYPCNYISWSDGYAPENEKGGVIELARSIYPESNTNLGAVSTIVYGVEWDAASEFCKTAGKSEYGNFLDSEYSFVGKYMLDENTNVYTTDSISSDKEKEKALLFTSGSSSFTRTNNIYDMAGSLDEWTMEGMTMITDDAISYGRIVRGGSYRDKKTEVSNRKYRIQNYMGMDVGFRTALYIK